MVATQTSYTVRPMQKGDIRQVSAIDREAFPTQWPPPPFRRDLDSRLVHYLVVIEEPESPATADIAEYEAEGSLHRLVSGVLARLGIGNSGGNGRGPRRDENVLAYAAMWQMVDEAHLTSIAVKASHRRQGIGELLLVCIIDLAMLLKSQVVTLETRVSNHSAQALYTKYGFITTGIRRGYYSDDGEDAVIMTTSSIASDEYRSTFQRLKLDYIQRSGFSHRIKLR